MILMKLQWIDVHNVAGGWHDTDELTEFAKNEAYIVTSIGYVVYADDNCIVLCSRYSPKTTEYGEHFGMLERIPKKCIESEEEIIPIDENVLDVIDEAIGEAKVAEKKKANLSGKGE